MGLLDFKFKLQYWPILSSSWLSFTYFSTYCIAVYKQDVSPIFPYISDTAAKPWESCYFAQMHNIGALFTLICMIIRHKLVELYFNEGQISLRLRKVNKFSLIFGFLGCLGMSLVANFQETSEIFTHLLGAFLAFFCTSIYFQIQTYISWKTDISLEVKFVRLILSALLFPFYTSTTIGAMVAVLKFKGTNVLKWGIEDGGYYSHLVSTFSEWILVGLMMIYTFSCSDEFKRIKFEGLNFSLKKKKSDEIIN
ncbi:unnamed protein product [Brassicogethes aeneus]|uniref:CWH43-like N-terminal domain-containing protein n=1 Tax=Brassicogethes aeneus TaxID=1431903 RepID=A0A9P0FGX4_BRAAE|nr:unnamed protein product [Brassicogethes aeneus]